MSSKWQLFIATDIDMAEFSAAGGTVPSWILNQANPNCDTCVESLTRAHWRLQEKTEMRRKYENLEAHNTRIEFSYVNHVSLSERTIERLEKALKETLEAKKAELEKSTALEKQHTDLAKKVEEAQARVHEIVAKSREEFEKEKRSLLAQLSDKINELKSEKEHKGLLLMKAMEQNAEIEKVREEKAQLERTMSHLHEEIENKLCAEVKAKDQKIEWLKQIFKEREEQHEHERRQATKARSDLINRFQAPTPSRVASPLQTSNRDTGSVSARNSLKQTPQVQQQASQNDCGRNIENSITASQNGLPASRRNSISTNIPQLPSATTPLQTGRRYKNVLTMTTPSNGHQNEAEQNTTPGLGHNRSQHSASASISTPSTLQTVNLQLATGFNTPQDNANQHQQMLQQWLVGNSLKEAQVRFASGQATDLDLVLLSDDPGLRSSAMQEHFNATMSSIQGIAIQREIRESMRRFQAQKQQNAVKMDFTTQSQYSPIMSSPVCSEDLLPSFNHHGIVSTGTLQNDSLQNGATSVMQSQTQTQALPPRRSPRLQKSHLAYASLDRQNAVRMPNPTHRTPKLLIQTEALHGTDAIRRTTNTNVSTPGLPHKPGPNDEWNSPVIPMNQFQGTMPTFQPPNPNTLLQQSVNSGSKHIDNSLETLGESSRFMNNENGLSQSNGQGSQQSGDRRPQTVIAGGCYLPHIEQHTTQVHPSSQNLAPTRPLSRAASLSPSRSPYRANVRAGTRISQPKDIPDGGHRGVVCKNCHHEWWNTWCDEEKNDTCYNYWKNGVDCERPHCPGFKNCKNPNCKNPRCKAAHERDGFVNTFEIENKRAMKRKNKMTDDHDEPPRKKMKDQGGDLEWEAGGVREPSGDH
ncbi:uncharacterized protein CC84DRAFT_1213021 [Paraphaeosphaeria sporulosa]|uniref:Uncharacterized protein n=1 Tax=Paraphaeosphaeria sporulosa TaxID=1460663 RepID=A0A177CRU3_9PLEO|nr:uncharacterized protein CC84DRAFT_1213021 [Paraphaeosphaeria sporulosa]OAG09610.1 hypothetical protein CC84DRAFT_1213021 [Paraphaeosphaeria sporulosa]